jgi:hypothetical protein
MELMKVGRSQSPFSYSLWPLMPVIGKTASLKTNWMWEAFPDAGQDRTCLTSLLVKDVISLRTENHHKICDLRGHFSRNLPGLLEYGQSVEAYSLPGS